MVGVYWFPEPPLGDMRKSEKPAQTSSQVPASMSADPQCSLLHAGSMPAETTIISFACTAGSGVMLMRAACAENTIVMMATAAMASMETTRANILER
ncbi:hypothetical protein Brsp07_04503 [Brucella sp. NBRC 14130]